MVLMASLARAFSYLIAAQVQAVALIMGGYYVGEWLNHNYPKGFNWFIVTFIVAMLGVIQTFYQVIRYVMRPSNRGTSPAPTVRPAGEDPRRP